MTKAHQEWKVLRHDKIKEVEPGILTVTGYIHMPLTELPRRMTVVRLSDGRLVVFSAIALNDAGMRTIERFGRPSFLVVPNGKHRLDAKIWQIRYPSMLVVAPEGARAQVEEVLPVDTTMPRFEDGNVEFIVVPGTKQREAALMVHSQDGATLVLNDLVGNIRNSTGFGGWFLRAMHFAGDEAQVPLPVKWTMIEDRDALRAQLFRWAELPTLRRILVSHGDIIDFQPAEVLRDLAHSLALEEPAHSGANTA